MARSKFDATVGERYREWWEVEHLSADHVRQKKRDLKRGRLLTDIIHRLAACSPELREDFRDALLDLLEEEVTQIVLGVLEGLAK